MALQQGAELFEDGRATVASPRSGTVVEHLVHGECRCQDSGKAPSHGCKHRIAAGLYKRAQVLVQRKLARSNGASHSQGSAAAFAPERTQTEPPAQGAHGVPAQDVVLIQG